MTGSLSTARPPAPAGPAPAPTAPEPRPGAGSIFQQHWWLDALAPGRWDEVRVQRGGEVVARLPFVVRGRAGMRVLTQPRLTATLGPWVARTPGAKHATALGDELELLAELERALPPAQAFRQDFAPEMLNALPFVWQRYRAEIRYTYRIAGLGDESALWGQLGGNIRREIKKARRRVEVEPGDDLDQFHQVWSKTFARQGLAAPPRDLLDRLDEACTRNDARSMLFARDDDGRVHAVAYIVWDGTAAYYLLGGGDPDLRTSGASSLLLWTAINRAREKVDVFDFEGSMRPPVERFFRAFGGRQTPYLHVSRARPGVQAALGLRAFAQSVVSRATGGRGR